MGIGIYTIASIMITKVSWQRVGRLTMNENVHVECVEDGDAQTPWAVSHSQIHVYYIGGLSRIILYQYGFSSRIQFERADNNYE